MVDDDAGRARRRPSRRRRRAARRAERTAARARRCAGRRRCRQMTRCSCAAQTASRNSCRSSLRGSRSPVRGSRASRSSPSATAWRGKLPSSMPSRQTTRCGTDRIGTRVQTVSVPVRNPARVGRPARRVLQQRGDVGQAECDVAPGGAVGDRRPTRAGPASACQGWSGSPRSSTRPVEQPHPLRDRVRARPGRVTVVSTRSSEFGEPAGELDVGAVDVVQRQRLADPPRSVLHRDAEQHPVATPPARCPGRCCPAGSARGAARRDPTGRRPRPSSRATARGRRRRSRTAVRTGAHPARSSSWVAVTRLAASSSSWASRLSSGLVWRSARSASRTRSRAAGCPPASSAMPNAAATSGANASTSGHMIEHVARIPGSGRRASRPRITSRTTSTWRAGPWPACTCRLSSPSATRSRDGGDGVVGELDPAAGPAACRGAGRPDGARRATGRRAAAAAARARRGPCRPAAGAGRPVPAAARRPGRSSPRATAAHSAGEGWCSHRCTSRERGQRAQYRHPGRREPGGSEDRERRAGGAPRRTPARAVRPAPERRSRPAGGATARPASRRSSGSGSPPPCSSASRLQASIRSRAGAAVAVEQPGQSGGDRQPPPLVPAAVQPEMGGEHRAPRFAPARTGRSPAAAARGRGPATTARPPRGSRARPRPPRRRAARCADGNSTFAHTPSPSRAPSTPASRCASQRSTPLLGTATISGRNGSSAGARSSSPSAVTRASERSERWITSTPGSCRRSPGDPRSRCAPPRAPDVDHVLAPGPPGPGRWNGRPRGDGVRGGGEHALRSRPGRR